MNLDKLSYTKSLRFKLMLLVVIPLVSVAVIYIVISMLTSQAMLKDLCEQNGIDMPSMTKTLITWAIVFVSSLVIVCIPITLTTAKIIKPLRDLVQVTRVLASGNANVDVMVTNSDEYGQLQNYYCILVEQIKKQSDALRRISEGDLTLEYRSNSEYDEVGESLIKLLENNNEVFNKILESARQVNSASSQVSDQSQALAQGSTEQNSMVAEINENVDHMTDTTVNSTKLASEAVLMTEEASELMEKSTTNMSDLEKAMADILTASSEVSKVIKVIDDIAFQTNILALNAAVEAARAGAAGKGFAVVADEVRNLASKSASAAAETSIIIDGTIQKIKSGSKILEHTSDSLKGIAENSDKVSDIIVNISEVTNEQHDSILRIQQSINQISETIAVNSAMAEESAASSEELSAQASSLQDIVQRFQLK